MVIAAVAPPVVVASALVLSPIVLDRYVQHGHLGHSAAQPLLQTALGSLLIGAIACGALWLALGMRVSEPRDGEDEPLP